MPQRAHWSAVSFEHPESSRVAEAAMLAAAMRPGVRSDLPTLRLSIVPASAPPRAAFARGIHAW